MTEIHLEIKNENFSIIIVQGGKLVCGFSK